MRLYPYAHKNGRARGGSSGGAHKSGAPGKKRMSSESHVCHRGMSVAEVRRGLDAVRTQWHQGGGARFYFTEKLFNGMTVQEFCTKFTLGHHTKRHAKSKRGAGADARSGGSATPSPHESPKEASPPATRARKRRKKTDDWIRRADETRPAGLSCGQEGAW